MHAQDRGLEIQNLAGLDTAVGKQWAVFIAIDRYREWAPLGNPVKDAKEIKDILLSDYFIDEVRELYDLEATAAGIRQLFANLRSQVGKDDSVFVFYAGHGHTDGLTQTGSWIPADGGRDEMAQANWLPNLQIRNMLSALPAKHVFLVSDSCFSGDMLDVSRGAGPVINSEYYRRAYSRVSRQVMTSGSSETVPDASEFALRFKSSLSRAQGACIDPQFLFTTVREVKSTQPMLGAIRGSEHQEGGSFLFFRRNPGAVTASRPENIPAPPAPSTGNPVIETKPSKPASDSASKLWSLGASVGTSFADPWFIGTVHGTIAALPYSFLHIGLDIGLASGLADTGYYSFYPFAHYAFFMPFSRLAKAENAAAAKSRRGGFYAGIGGGYLFSEYNFSGTKHPLNMPAGDLIAGVNILNMIDISYTIRTNFKVASNKVSVGYMYRFK